jgi:hypothetical protein
MKRLSQASARTALTARTARTARTALTALTALLLTALAPSPARADDFLLEGGKLLQRGDDAIRAAIGFPGLQFSFHTPLSPILEIGPEFEFTYGAELGIEAPVVGVGVGCQLKFRLYESGEFGLLLLVDPMARFAFHPGTAVNIRAGVTLRGSYGVSEQVDVLFRFGLPVEFTVYPHFVFWLPIAFGGGLEIEVTEDVHLYFTSDVGPVVMALENATDVDVYYKGELGVAYRF